MEEQSIKNQEYRTRNKTIFLIFGIILILVVISGSTFAKWVWKSSDDEKTSVVFTSTKEFNCSADGGGNITSSDLILIPTTCDDSEHVIKRKVLLTTELLQSDVGVYMDLWLKVNSIGSGLANSQNFRYALTSSDTSCFDGVISSGSFYGVSNGGKLSLIGKNFNNTVNETYYLWIWLDEEETNVATTKQTFDLSLDGLCSSSLAEQQIIISYDANGGKEAPINQVKILNTPLELSSSIPQREQYVFVAWNTKSDGTGDSYSPGDTYSVDESVTLYAIWKEEVSTSSIIIPIADTHCRKSLEYNGSVQVLTYSDSENYSFSNNTQINANTYTVTATLNSKDYLWSDGTFTDKTFKCNIKKKNVTIAANSQQTDVSGNVLTDVSQITSSGLIAGHVVNSVTLTASELINSEGTIVPSNAKIWHGGTDVTDNYNITYKTGKVTKGPNLATIGTCITPTYNGTSQQLVKDDGVGVTYSNAEGINAGAYTITVNANSGYAFSDGLTSKTVICYIGKNSSTIGDEQIPDELSFTYASEVVQHTFSYTYDGDGILGCHSTNPNITCTLDRNNETATIKVNDVKEKVVVEGKETYEDAPQVKATITLSATEGINYLAPAEKHEINVSVEREKYTISYDANGGSKAPEPQIKYYGIDLKLSDETPEREGYDFLGWSDKQDATTPSIQPEADYTTNAELKLYAVWQGGTGGTLVNYIESLYDRNDNVTNNSVTYYVDNVNKLIADGNGIGIESETLGNIRYYGEEPNNYIYFNCDTYPSTNCEMWRIIGLFTVNGERRIKIIRSTPIQRLTFDNSLYDISNNYIGFYEWKHSRLMMLLNPETYKSNFTTYSYERGLYWNKEDGTCYDGDIDYDDVKDKTTTCNFGTNNIGLRNETTRNMIAETLFKLGTSAEIGSTNWYRAARYANEVYNQERALNTDEWTGNIGLPFASDYGYASDFENCKVHLREGKQDNCDNYNWMNNNKDDFWTMTRVWWGAYYFQYCGLDDCPNNPYTYMEYTPTWYDHHVYPTVYLEPSILKVNDDIIDENGEVKKVGSYYNPYQIKLP